MSQILLRGHGRLLQARPVRADGGTHGSLVVVQEAEGQFIGADGLDPVRGE